MPGTSGLDFASWVVKHYPLTQIIFLTGHAKFDYAYKAIQISAFDYILKPVKHEVLIECVRRAQDFIRTEKAKNSYAKQWSNYLHQTRANISEKTQLFWRNVIDNRMSQKYITSWFVNEGISIENQGEVFPIAIWVKSHAGHFTTNKKEALIDELKEKLYSGIIEEYGGCCIEEEGMDILLLLYHQPENIERLLNSTFIKLGGLFNCSITWKAGEPSLPEALWRSIYRIKYPTKNKNEHNSDAIPIDWKTAFIRYPTNKLHEQVDHAISFYRGNKNSIGLPALYHEFKGAMLSLAAEYGFSTHTIDLLSRKFEFSKSHEDLSMWMHSVIDACSQDINTSLRDKNSIIENVIRYIKANLDSELTRENIASHVYVHPVYLSRIFKQEMGISLSDYITNERIRKAKMILKDPSIRVGSVAHKVGYKRLSYFSRVFRQMTGMSPQEYQHKVKSEA
jgi:two-component system response regulator YesN